jgi:hypothetical protein
MDIDPLDAAEMTALAEDLDKRCHVDPNGDREVTPADLLVLRLIRTIQVRSEAANKLGREQAQNAVRLALGIRRTDDGGRL